MESGEPGRGGMPMVLARREPRPPYLALFSGFRHFGFSRLIPILLLLLLIPAGCSAHSLVVVVANRLLLDDLDNPALKNIARMMREGGVGFVCPNCAGPKTEASVMMTAGAGAGCESGDYSGEFYAVSSRVQSQSLMRPDSNVRSQSLMRTHSNVRAQSLVRPDEVAPDGMMAGDSYRVRTGYRARPGSMVFLGIGRALRDNAESSHTSATIGACGNALKSAGLRTCFIGNADLPGKIDRSAAVLAMDGEGQVDYGLPEAGFSKLGVALDEPAGVLSDVGAIAESVRRNIGKFELVVVSFGDAVRLDELGSDLSDKAAKDYKAAALRNLDALIGELMPGSKNGTAKLMLVSFSPPGEGAWNRLTPIITWPSASPGLLTSASTRTPGFVAASDFAPTVIGLLNVKSLGEIVGRPIQEIAGSGSKLASLHASGRRVTANEVMLAPVLLSIAFTGALMFTLVSLFTAFSRKMSARATRALNVCLLVSGSWPLALLLAVMAPAGAMWYVSAVVVIAVLSMAASLLLGPILARIGWRFGHLMAIYMMTLIAVIADTFNGCQLGKFALLGAYQITAMRFYGIGNEYAGIIISMAACFCLFAPQRLRITLVSILGALLILIFGIGAFGANYGAAVATAVTFGLLWFSVKRSSFGLRHVVLVLIVAVALVFSFALADYKMAGSAASHAGRATGLIQKMGGQYVFALVARKVLLNLKHLTGKHAFWVFASFVPFLALWFWGVQGKVIGQFKADRAIVTGLKAIMIGAAAAFMFNDSGLVMASIMVCMTFLVLVYSLIVKQEGECQE